MPWDIDPAVAIPVVLAVLGCNLVCLIVLLAARPASRGAEESAALARSVRGALSEGVGTFVLLSVCMLPVVDPMHGIAIAAATLIVLVAAFGGHFNPAVTLGMVAAGRFGVLAGVGYISAQMCGAIASAVAFASFSGLEALAAFPPAAFPVEAMGGAFLVLAVAGCTAGEAKRHAPLCVGLALGTAGLLALAHGGGAFNPAKHAAAAMLTAKPGPWLACLLGPLAGAAATGLVMRGLLEPVPESEEARPKLEARKAA